MLLEVTNKDQLYVQGSVNSFVHKSSWFWGDFVREAIMSHDESRPVSDLINGTGSSENHQAATSENHQTDNLVESAAGTGVSGESMAGASVNCKPLDSKSDYPIGVSGDHDTHKSYQFPGDFVREAIMSREESSPVSDLINGTGSSESHQAATSENHQTDNLVEYAAGTGVSGESMAGASVNCKSLDGDRDTVVSAKVTKANGELAIISGDNLGQEAETMKWRPSVRYQEAADEQLQSWKRSRSGYLSNLMKFYRNADICMLKSNSQEADQVSAIINAVNRACDNVLIAHDIYATNLSDPHEVNESDNFLLNLQTDKVNFDQNVQHWFKQNVENLYSCVDNDGGQNVHQSHGSDLNMESYDMSVSYQAQDPQDRVLNWKGLRLKGHRPGWSWSNFKRSKSFWSKNLN